MSHFTVLVVGPDPEGQLAPYDEHTEVEPYEEDCWCVTHPVPEDETCDERGGSRKATTTSNPLSKWDWYVLGGRWRGFFKAKQGALAAVGGPGTGDNAPTYDADQLVKGAIDWDEMWATAEAEAHRTYDAYEKAILAAGDLSGYREWDAVLTDYGLAIDTSPRETSGLTGKALRAVLDAARSEYHAQPYVRALKEYRDGTEKTRFGGLWPWDGNPTEVYGGGRDVFVKRARDRVAVPHAILHNGDWIEKGRMGWFGVVRDEKPQEDWNAQVAAFYASLPDDTLLSVYDCHI